MFFTATAYKHLFVYYKENKEKSYCFSHISYCLSRYFLNTGFFCLIFWEPAGAGPITHFPVCKVTGAGAQSRPKAHSAFVVPHVEMFY